MNNRIYEKKEIINEIKVRDFFENRPIDGSSLASVMLRKNNDDLVAIKRNQNEVQLINKLLDFSKNKNILDLGCGCGRLASPFIQNITFYDGIDFAKNYIDLAKENFAQHKNIQFHQMSVTDLDRTILNKDYDYIFITALCLYLNDDTINTLFKTIKDFCKQSTHIYLRESISTLETRLTLKDFPSEDLGSEYNAIYRTAEEYESIIKSVFPNATIKNSDLLLTEETGVRKETNQMYWLIQL